MRRGSKGLAAFGVFLLALAQAAPASASQLPGSDQAIEARWLAAVPASDDTPPGYANRLALSESAYLAQHATNPIDWYPWGDDAFAKSKNQNKLIFLSIGYASCHWCHVMERESFADEAVAIALNQSFVSIKVDREQQPDVDAHYMKVVETIRGESGWPMTIVLTPGREPVFAANYLEKSQLLTLLGHLDIAWRETPEVLQENARLFAEAVRGRRSAATAGATEADPQWPAVATAQLLESADPVHAGFGAASKFPSEVKLQFLLNAYKADRDPALKRELVRQLDSVMNSGLSDIVFGGVFRYTTDREMTRPHFEKMLYNQALVAYLFADAADWLEMPAYARFADSIVQFVDQSLRLEDGLYAAALDAEFEGVEGGYYLWPESITRNLPEGVSALSLGDERFFIHGAFNTPGMGTFRSQLTEQRDSPPRRIDNRITAWNALWIKALLRTGNPDQAASLAGATWASAWVDGVLHRMPGQPGFLDDYGYLSEALWRLYRHTGDQAWKQKAKVLDEKILQLFCSDGGITYSSRQSADAFSLDVFQDTELPAPTASVLGSFSHHGTDPRFIEAGESIRNEANQAIGDRPEYYASLVQQGMNYGERSGIVANGHGVVSLRPTDEAGRWRLALHLDPGWHVNAAEVLEEHVKPMQVLGEEVDIRVDFPDGELIDTEFSENPLNIYSDAVFLDVEAAPDNRRLDLEMRLQACNDRVCLLPEAVQLSAFMPVE